MDFKTSDKEYTLNTLVEKASRKVVRQTVGEYLNGYIDRLLAEKRVGNAKTFQELRTSLTKFCRSLDFYFIDIDAEWLKRYEQWLRWNGIIPTTPSASVSVRCGYSTTAQSPTA